MAFCSLSGIWLRGTGPMAGLTLVLALNLTLAVTWDGWAGVICRSSVGAFTPPYLSLTLSFVGDRADVYHRQTYVHVAQLMEVWVGQSMHYCVAVLRPTM